MEIMDNTKLRISYNIKNHCGLFFNNPNITGFARGNKIINGVMTDVPALMIYVKKKLMPSAINSYNFIPKYFNGILTDVYESGENKFIAPKIRPAVGGIQIGVEAVQNGVHGWNDGTLGYAVTDYKKEKLYILTCAHVVAANNKLESPPQIVTQPSEGPKIGVVEKIIPIKYISDSKDVKDEGVSDAALVYVGANDFSAQSLLLRPRLSNRIAISGTSKVKIGDDVWKIGSATGRTDGKVIGVEARLIAKAPNGVDTILTNMIATTNKTFYGDSGSIGMLGNTNKAFGMLCIGASAVAHFSAIDDVLKALSVEIAQLIP